MIRVLDADLHGNRSTQKYVVEGKVQMLPCASAVDLYRHIDALVPIIYEERQRGEDPLTVFDTATSMTSLMRSDQKLENVTDLWAARGKYGGKDDSMGLSIYDYIRDVLRRIIWNLRAVDARIVIVAHEDDQMDGKTDRVRAPSMPGKTYEALASISSDMFRLTATDVDVKQNGEILYPAGTRFLTMRKDGEAAIKFQTDRDLVGDVPAVMVNPTMRKIWKVLHGKPRCMIIYGPPGVGKSTLAVSEAEPARKRAATTDNTPQTEESNA